MTNVERTVRVGLISDTHGRLDPRAVLAFEREGQLAAIVHAGDIGASPTILYELEAIAPVTAVLGNCDAQVPGFELGGSARLVVDTLRLLVIHDFADLGPIPDDVDVVVCGHTHVPSACWHGRVMVVNPGSATRCGREGGCSVGVLDMAEGRLVSTRTVLLDELGQHGD